MTTGRINQVTIFQGVFFCGHGFFFFSFPQSSVVLRVSFFFLHAVVLFPRLSSVRKEKTLEKITSTRRKKKRTRTAFSFPSEGSSCWFVSVPVRNHRKRFQKILFFHNPKKKNLQKLFIVSKNWLGFCSAFPFF